MHHPFYDPSEYTDNQLLEKTYELVEKKSHAQRMNMPTLSDNIDMLLYEIQMEQEKRMIQEEKDYNEKNDINTLEPITLGEIEEIIDKEE